VPGCQGYPRSTIEENTIIANPQNEAIVRRMLDFINQHQLPSDYEQIFDPGYDNHAPLGTRRGPEGFKDIYNFWHGPLSDLRLRIEQLFSDGDFVGAQWRVTGTHTGEFFGTKPTGKPIDVMVTGIFRCHNGKVAEAWVTPDRLGMMQQLGIVPAPGNMPQQRAA
jgi:predicted ester cyclase